MRHGTPFLMAWHLAHAATSKPYPSNRQRVKGTLGMRLKQLCIKVELEEERMIFQLCKRWPVIFCVGIRRFWSKYLLMDICNIAQNQIYEGAIKLSHFML